VEIVADAICTVEIVDSRSRRHIDDATLFIESHAGPVVGSAGHLPRILRPRLVPRLSRTRNSVKDPTEFASMHIVGANITAKCRLGFRRAKADDDRVLVDQTRRRESSESL